MLTLDRWLLVSLRRRDRPLSTLLQAIPVIALGIVLGAAIATPLTLRIFQPEIRQQIRTIQSQEANAYVENLSVSPLYKKILSDRTTINSLQATLAGGGPGSANPSRDPIVQSLEQQLNQAQKEANIAYRRWQCELYGQPAGYCSGIAGNGVLAEADHQRYLNALSIVNTDNAQLQAARAQLAANDRSQQQIAQTEAEKALPAAERSLQADLAEQSQLTTSFLRANSSNTGLLTQLQALGNLASRNGTVNGTRWLLAILFALISMLPFLMKMLLNLGPENTYEKMVAIEENLQLRLARDAAIHRQEAELKELDDVISKTRRVLFQDQDPEAGSRELDLIDR